MTDGLITRLGQWIDRKWEAKATESALVAVSMDAAQALKEFREKIELDCHCLNQSIEILVVQVNKLMDPVNNDKELADLKTRMEKMELYAGMTRKVDPTKPPVVKSAFQM